MSFPYEFLKAVQESPLADAVAESNWLFPTIETVHVLALTLVVGSIAIVDLRLLGLASRQRHVKQLAEQILPFTWAAFAFALISGALLFSSAAVKYYDNVPFRIKFGFLLLAGLNMALFHAVSYRQVAQWGGAIATPRPARLAGALSLLFWVGVVAAGRWIAFTGH